MRLDVDGERAHRARTGEQLHVYVNGIDVTRRCFLADTNTGYAMVFCEDPIAHDPWCSRAAPQRHLNERDPIVCLHRLDGQIEIRLGER